MIKREEFKFVLLGLVFLFVITGGVLLAGDLINNSEPEPTAMTYSLEEIYQKLTTEDYNVMLDHNLNPGTLSPGESSLRTLSAVYGAVPAYKTLDGSTTTIERGIYEAVTLSDLPSSGLVPENIATGTTIFGVTGAFNCVQ